MMKSDNFDKAHNLAEELTGDSWCPYMSDLFVEAVLTVDKETARELIVERRKYLFPNFLVGEPQLDRLLELFKGK